MSRSLHEKMVRSVLRELKDVFLHLGNTVNKDDLEVCPIAIMLDIGNNLTYNGLLNLDPESRLQAIKVIEESAFEYRHMDWEAELEKKGETK